ncbi:MAG: hypothetical protein R3F14_01125 [Polyangiaceae bacterium]
MIATNTRSAQAAAVFTTTGERARIDAPLDRTVVLSPDLVSPTEAAPAAAPAPSAAAAAPPGSAPQAQDPGVVVAAAPLVIPEMQAPKPSRAGLISVAVGAALLAVAVTVVALSLRGGDAAGAASGIDPTAAGASAAAPAATSAKSAPSSKAGAAPRTSGAPAASAAPVGVEAEAREALARLREGIGTCARDVIGLLPGTSPAVPAQFAALARGAYQSSPRDFRSPVFSCAKYKETAPQRFQIQWQLTKRPTEGRGVAWVDDNTDGKPDRAFSFRATLLRKNEVELGEITLLDPMPDPLKAP